MSYHDLSGAPGFAVPRPALLHGRQRPCSIWRSQCHNPPRPGYGDRGPLAYTGADCHSSRHTHTHANCYTDRQRHEHPPLGGDTCRQVVWR